MIFEYYLLLGLSILPIVYKLFFWSEIFSTCKYNLKDFFHSFKDVKKRENYLHFWTLIEFPLFLFSFLIIYKSHFETLIFPLLFYTLLLYNVFVLGKIFRGNLKLIGCKNISFLTLICIIFDMALGIYWNDMFIYTSILTALLCMPLYFIFVIGLENILSKIFKKGKK